MLEMLHKFVTRSECMYPLRKYSNLKERALYIHRKQFFCVWRTYVYIHKAFKKLFSCIMKAVTHNPCVKLCLKTT